MTHTIHEIGDLMASLTKNYREEWPNASYSGYQEDPIHSARFQSETEVYQQKMLKYIMMIRDQRYKKGDIKQMFYWMTINFSSEKTLEEISNVLVKLSGRSFMTQYHYNIEQRYPSPTAKALGDGIHSHWVVVTNHPFAQFRRDVFNTLKSYVGCEQHVDIRRYSMSLLPDKLAYLRGEKWDPEKDSKVEADKQFRAKYFLDPIYTNAPDYASSPPIRPSSI